MHADLKLFTTGGKVEQCRSTDVARLARSFIKKHDVIVTTTGHPLGGRFAQEASRHAGNSYAGLFNPFLNTIAPNQVSFRAGSDCVGIPALPRTSNLEPACSRGPIAAHGLNALREDITGVCWPWMEELIGVAME